ncbi:conserved protein of unknown function [Petrocella atlantisensis]|uniref:Cell wall-active antibiotics response LiaF-like C-terminal domain-containing protein n=1 Tax=Petrocella atlantisensis TaxID=2173034 RepID=A0A3P7NUL0_9FIRM|nr:hypothetical protein [Petrocella atlantisensis]PKM55799.1 MAG: hypothetical protein CVV00_02570 [Firmicutes bacterium HGW-Firmicutes-5]VDN46575.1 conserved protein of unknown function [Petrocella atlantisensis]
MKKGKIIGVAGLAALAGSGYAAYKTMTKVKVLKATYDQVIAFNGSEKKYETFEGDSYAAVFAGVEIDLSEAEMVGDSASLRIYAEFAGVEITVPKDWNVKVDGIADKAGVSNQVDYRPDDTTSKRLTIDYNIKFAGLEIKRVDEEDTIEVEIEDEPSFGDPEIKESDAPAES